MVHVLPVLLVRGFTRSMASPAFRITPPASRRSGRRDEWLLTNTDSILHSTYVQYRTTCPSTLQYLFCTPVLCNPVSDRSTCTLYMYQYCRVTSPFLLTGSPALLTPAVPALPSPSIGLLCVLWINHWSLSTADRMDWLDVCDDHWTSILYDNTRQETQVTPKHCTFCVGYPILIESIYYLEYRLIRVYICMVWNELTRRDESVPPTNTMQQ